MKIPGKGFSGKVIPLFQTMMVQAPENMGEDSTALTDSHSTHIITQPSSSKPQKKQSRRKQRKDSGPTEPIPDEATNEEHVSTPSYDPPQSGDDRLQLTELMSLCTSLQEKVLDLEKAKSAQTKEIASLKKRVKQLEKRKKSRTLGLKRLRKVGSASRVESSNDVRLERNDEEMLFDVKDDLQGKEVVAEKEVSAADPVTTGGEVVTTANVEVTTASTPTTTIDELEQEKAKKKKGDDDQEEEEMKKHMEIVQDNDVAIDAIPLATKPPMIVEYKIDKEGKMGYFKLIRADF
ncbi:hypothetical protein Tco_1172742 [Tanacetum coccineum]